MDDGITEYVHYGNNYRTASCVCMCNGSCSEIFRFTACAWCVVRHAWCVVRCVWCVHGALWGTGVHGVLCTVGTHKKTASLRSEHKALLLHIQHKAIHCTVLSEMVHFWKPHLSTQVPILKRKEDYVQQNCCHNKSSSVHHLH